jgi:hypothetical protein
MYQILFQYPRFEQLKQEVIELQSSLSLQQISVQTEGDDNWLASTQCQKKPEDELRFCELNPKLKGTELEKYIEWVPFKIVRTRIMTMLPGKNYVVHADATPRLHLPITTNDDALFFLLDDKLSFNMKADGSVYKVDTTQKHTASNHGKTSRIHLVSVIPNIS